MKLIVHEAPFSVSAQVIDENGVTIGHHSVSDMINFPFQHIQAICFGNWWGGDYYIKNMYELPGESTEISLLSPIETFRYLPDFPEVYETAVFNASACYSPSRQIVSYLWDFGDRIVASIHEPTISYTYWNAGTYNVTLNTTDSSGLTASLSRTISIGSPAASPSQTPTTAPASTPTPNPPNCYPAHDSDSCPFHSQHPCHDT